MKKFASWYEYENGGVVYKDSNGGSKLVSSLSDSKDPHSKERDGLTLAIMFNYLHAMPRHHWYKLPNFEVSAEAMQYFLVAYTDQYAAGVDIFYKEEASGKIRLLFQSDVVLPSDTLSTKVIHFDDLADAMVWVFSKQASPGIADPMSGMTRAMRESEVEWLQKILQWQVEFGKSNSHESEVKHRDTVFGLQLSELPRIPHRANPFNFDLYHMGTDLSFGKDSNKLLVMHSSKLDYIILVFTETGRRIKISIPDEVAKLDLANPAMEARCDDTD